MSVIESVKNWSQKRQKSAISGWALLREQLISGQLDDEGIAAAESLGFAAEQLPEMESQVQQRLTDRKILEGKPELEKQFNVIQAEIKKRSEAFARDQDNHQQAIEQLVAGKHAVEFSLAAADGAANRLRQTVLDPSVARRHEAINDAIKRLGTERSSLTELAVSHRTLLRQAEAELAHCEPADRERFKAMVQRCQSQSAPTLARLAEIDAEVAELHQQASINDAEKLFP